MNDIKPFGKRILLTPESTDTGFISNNQGMITTKSRVLAIGDEVKRVEEGDIIITNLWGTDEIEIDGQKLFFVTESDEFILGICTKKVSV